MGDESSWGVVWRDFPGFEDCLESLGSEEILVFGVCVGVVVLLAIGSEI